MNLMETLQHAETLRNKSSADWLALYRANEALMDAVEDLDDRWLRGNVEHARKIELCVQRRNIAEKRSRESHALAMMWRDYAHDLQFGPEKSSEALAAVLEVCS